MIEYDILWHMKDRIVDELINHKHSGAEKLERIFDIIQKTNLMLDDYSDTATSSAVVIKAQSDLDKLESQIQELSQRLDKFLITDEKEWILVADNMWECPECHTLQCCTTKYCGTCGTRMKTMDSGLGY